MTEVVNPGFDPFVHEEVEKVRFLQGLTDRPGAFLFAQNELLYNRDLSHLTQAGDLNAKGLPTATDDFYQRGAPERPHIGDKLPRVLNIGSGAEASRKLDAINVDVSADGKPEVVADAQHLPFADGSMA